MKWSSVSLVECHNNKNKIHISPFDSNTAFLILLYIVITQKFRQLRSFFTCPVFLVSSDVLSLLVSCEVTRDVGTGDHGFPCSFPNTVPLRGTSVEAAPVGQNAGGPPDRRGVAVSRVVPTASPRCFCLHISVRKSVSKGYVHS